jgi:predicted DNA-binding protein
VIRTQIQLTEEQARKLKRVAADRGISMARVIREAVDRELQLDDIEARRQRALAAVQRGGFRSGKTDIAEEHDKYLAEDFGT